MYKRTFVFYNLFAISNLPHTILRSMLDARRRAQQKKDEDRIKWLLGTLVFDRLSTEPALQSIVRRDLPERMTQRDQTRGLWGMLFPEEATDASEGSA